MPCFFTGEKPYVCTVAGCGKKFTEYSSLYKHHVVHTHSKPYICNRCGKTYRQTSTLAMHKRTAHGEEVTAESEAELYAQQQQHITGSHHYHILHCCPVKFFVRSDISVYVWVY